MNVVSKSSFADKEAKPIMQSPVPIVIASGSDKRDVGPTVTANENTNASDTLQRLTNNKETTSSHLSPPKTTVIGNRRRSSSVRSALSAFFGAGTSPTSNVDDYSNPATHNYTTAPPLSSRFRGNSLSSDVPSNTYTGTGSYQPQRHRNSVPYTAIDQLHTRQDTGMRRESDPVALKKFTSGNNGTLKPLMSHRSESGSSFVGNVLSDYLTDRGFIKQKLLYNKKNVLDVSIATSAESVFLPTTKSNETEYLSLINGSLDRAQTQPLVATNTVGNELSPFSPGMDTLNENNDLSLLSLPTQRPIPANTANIDSTGFSNMAGNTSSTSNNNTTDTDSLGSNHNIVNNTGQVTRNTHSHSRPRSRSRSTAWNTQMPSFSFALIFCLNRPATLTDIKVELTSNVRIVWFNGLPPAKSVNEECYNIGALDWTLNADNFNLFIPRDAKSLVDIVENHSNTRRLKVLQKLSMRKRHSFSSKTMLKENILNKLNSSDASNKLNAGVYIFTIPIILANHIPESLYYPSAKVSYTLRLATRLEDEHSQVNTSQPHPTSLSSSVDPHSHTYCDPNENSRADDTIEGETYNTDSKSRSKTPFPSSWLKNVKGRLKLNSSNGGIECDSNGSLTAADSASQRADLNSLVYSEYPLHLVRTPPEISITTANKPLYINKVWENSLSYEISFAQKYVPLNGKIPITIKVAPLVKTITVKRIRVSCREKISFRSKDYQHDFDQLDPLALDPCNPYHMRYLVRKKKDRSLPLFEVASKSTSGPAIREEVVNNTIDDNLLAYTSTKEKNKNIPFSESFTIKTKLNFPKYSEIDATKTTNLPTYGIDLFDPIKDSGQVESTSNNSNMLGFLMGHSNKTSNMPHKLQPEEGHNNFKDQGVNEVTTLQTSSNVPVQFYTRLNKPRRGLYLDSMHFKNIQCSHKLEIVLRVSKTDDSNPQLTRHYEIIVDTPIYLISDLCNTSNIDLPTYDMATTESSKVLPPTFEEATSVSASPRSSLSYYPDDISMQQLHLSRSTSLANGYLSKIHSKATTVSETFNSAPFQGQKDQQPHVLRTEDFSPQMTNAENTYNNMDGLLSQDILEQRNVSTLLEGDNTTTMDFNKNIFTPRGNPCTLISNDDDYNDIDNDKDGPGPIVHPGTEPPRYDEISS